MVGVENGFLPRQDPLPALPERFKELESLLQRMPIVMANGQPGLLASGKFGEAVEKELPLYDLSDIEDTRLLAGMLWHVLELLYSDSCRRQAFTAITRLLHRHTFWNRAT